MAVAREKRPGLASTGRALVSSAKRPDNEPFKGFAKQALVKQCEVARASKQQVQDQTTVMRKLLSAQQTGLNQAEQQARALVEILPQQAASNTEVQRRVAKLHRSQQQVMSLHSILSGSLEKMEAAHDQAQTLHLKQTQGQMGSMYKMFQAQNQWQLPQQQASGQALAPGPSLQQQDQVVVLQRQLEEALREQQRLRDELSEEKRERAREVEDLRLQIAAPPQVLHECDSCGCSEKRPSEAASTCLPWTSSPAGTVGTQETARSCASSSSKSTRRLEDVQRPTTSSETMDAWQAERPSTAPEPQLPRSAEPANVAKRMHKLEAELLGLVGHLRGASDQQSDQVDWASEEESV